MQNPETIRLSIFLSAFIVFFILEKVFSYNTPNQKLSARLICNIGMSITSTLLLKVLGLLGLAAFGQWVYGNNTGLLAGIPFWPSLIMTIIIFDLAIYGQHVATHRLPWLWRLHKVHHADRDLDVSSAIRFHPVEIALSYIFKLALIFILGPPFIAILIFEIILNASAMFNHANFALPKKVDAWASKIMVTPTMHRVHHSTDFGESNSNYGFFFSFWDKAFNTYTQKDNRLITLGLEEEQHNKTSHFLWSVLLPLKKKNK